MIYVIATTPMKPENKDDFIKGHKACIAETHTHVTQRKTPTTVGFEITTGMLAGEGPFAAHGHVIVLRIAGPGVEALLKS